jgi:alcohol dehydrogenase (cytochrome c)
LIHGRTAEAGSRPSTLPQERTLALRRIETNGSQVAVPSSGLIFSGESSVDFIALDAENGKVLYRFNVGGPIAGGVITYEIGGKQFVAAVSGFMSKFFELNGADQGGTPTVVLFSAP